MLIRKAFFSLFTIVLLGLFSCNNSGFPGFKKGNGGLLYKFHKNESVEKAHPGDYLTVEMTYYTNEDSLLFDSKGQTFPLRLEEPVFKGDINEALSMMGIGDSATFVIRADSFLIKNAKLKLLPSFVSDKSKIIFNVKVHNIQTLEQLESENKANIQKAQSAEEESIVQYIEDNQLDTEPDENGMFVIVQKKGNGKLAKRGDKVEVHYTGKLITGEVFDSSYERNKPVTFTLGNSEVIPGLDLGVQKLHKGDEALLIIPSYLGYGSGRNAIPPYTPLIFEVKLVDIK